MDSEKVGILIKEIREKNGLTQKDLADKLNVTYQAVSKWETGKNLPDISIIKKISDEFSIDIDDFLNGEYKKNNDKQTKKWIKWIFALILLIITITIIVLINNANFKFKKISSSCKDFNVTGSIAYNNKKTSIYISDISKCESDKREYKFFKCNLIEKNGENKTIISSYTSNKNLSLENHLKKLKLNIDNYKRKCSEFKNNNLRLEITLKDENNKTTKYVVPLKLENNC